MSAVPAPAPRRALLLAGAPPGEAAGNPVSTEVLLDALSRVAEVALLSHIVSAAPRFREEVTGRWRHVRLGTQPIVVHGEALPAGWLFRRRLAAWSGAWVVNSRYAGAVFAAGLPYVIWEATTIRDELAATGGAASRRAGRGSGLGLALHRLLLPLDERLERRLYRGARVLCAMSEYTRDRIAARHGWPPDAVRLLRHPPTRQFLAALDRARNAAVPETRGRGGPLRLLFVGRVDDPRKHFGLLLDAFRALRRDGLSLTLTVVGPYRPRWRAQLEATGSLDGIELRGLVPLEELARAYLTHDALVLSSRQEGFGIVVAEALHAGLPVIATRCGGPERAIADSGAGVLTDHTPASLAAAVRALAAQPELRAAWSARARRYAARELSFDAFAAEVAQICGVLPDQAASRRVQRR